MEKKRVAEKKAGFTASHQYQSQLKLLDRQTINKFVWLPTVNRGQLGRSLMLTSPSIPLGEIPKDSENIRDLLLSKLEHLNT